MSDEQPPSRAAGNFPTTRWSLVGRVGAARRAHRAPVGAADEKAALSELIRIYLPALRAHLVGPLRIDVDRADDLLQGFLTDKVVAQNLVALADPNRGKFRSFLLTALQRFAIDLYRREHTARRAPRNRPQDVDEMVDRLRSGSTPTTAFDRAWAGEVLAEVMLRLRNECKSSDRMHLWHIFEARMLLPITDGTEPPSHEVLAERLCLASATQSANALGSAKRLFTRFFREVVSEYAGDESEIDDEIRDLWRIFSKPVA